MFTLRCTRKLLRRLGAKPSSEVVEPSTALGDWYANLLHLRPQQLILAMNERSLLCVLVPAAPIGSVGERLRTEVAGLLTDIGVPSGLVAAERAAMESMADRSQRARRCRTRESSDWGNESTQRLSQLSHGRLAWCGDRFAAHPRRIQ